MLNHIVLMGRLTRDPELRRTGNGTPVATFTIAVDRDYSGKDGGEKEVDFIDIVTWRNTAEFVSKYFSKGRMAVVAGRLQIRNWTDKEGNKRRNAEVIADNVYFGDNKKEGAAPAQRTGYDGEVVVGQFCGYDYDGGYGGTGYPTAMAMPTGSYTPPQSDYAMLEDDDGELPF